MLDTSCSHDWELRPLASSNKAQRYQCTMCHRWAFRLWVRGKGRSPLKAYDPPVLTPDPLWLDTERPDERDVKERGQRHGGSRMVLDPERLRSRS